MLVLHLAGRMNVREWAELYEAVYNTGSDLGQAYDQRPIRSGIDANGFRVYGDLGQMEFGFGTDGAWTSQKFLGHSDVFSGGNMTKEQWIAAWMTTQFDLTELNALRANPNVKQVAYSFNKNYADSAKTIATGFSFDLHVLLVEGIDVANFHWAATTFGGGTKIWTNGVSSGVVQAQKGIGESAPVLDITAKRKFIDVTTTVTQLPAGDANMDSFLEGVQSVSNIHSLLRA